MPMSGLNVGSDAQFVVVTSIGNLSLPTLINFDFKQEVIKQKVRPLNATNIPLRFFDGWSGTFEVERADSTLDDYFALMEQTELSGSSMPLGTIQQTIQTANSTVEVWQFQGVVLSFDDAGKYEKQKTVMQKVSFECATRVRLS